MAIMGYISIGLGELEEAQHYLSDALNLAHDIKGFYPKITALPASALIFSERKEFEKAVELYALAFRYPRVANSVWFNDIAGKHINDISTKLSPEKVKSARERGQDLDLDETITLLREELYHQK